MQHLEQLIDTLIDETGIGATVEVFKAADGWCARVVDDGMTLLCPAGEVWLNTRQHPSAEDALNSLDKIAETGFYMASLWETR